MLSCKSHFHSRGGRRALLLLGVLSLLAKPVRAEDGPPARRYALVVGSNLGDASDVALKYAETDARRMMSVLTAVGDVAPEYTTLLVGADARELRTKLDMLFGRLTREAWGAKDLLFVYVSGHASEGELHLGGRRFPVRELRDFLSRVPVGIAVLVLDTCEAGVATREKGLAPVDGSSDVSIVASALSGRVVIASSGANEASLESDSLGGSYFTHHFIAGLRGAADTSHDGVVTLQEAYAYSYTRTVDSTTGARTGRQTPVYDVRLRGEGDLVLTEPAKGRSRLRLNIARPSEFLLVSLDGASTVARFVKAAGAALFTLEPGRYRLRLLDDQDGREATFSVPDGGQVQLTERDLKPVAAVAGLSKGLATLPVPPTLVPATPALDPVEARPMPMPLPPRDLVEAPRLESPPSPPKDPPSAPAPASTPSRWFIGAGGGIASASVPGIGGLPRGQLTLRRTLSEHALGADLVVAIEGAFQRAHLTGKTPFTQDELEAALGVGWQWQRGRWSPRALLKGGALMVHQVPAEGAGQWGTQVLGGVELGLAVTVAGPLVAEVSMTPGALLVRRISGTGLRPSITAVAGLGVAF